ncbi:hypothetical protein GCK32_005344 [Trichostrongylus colubriformis]|uniref:Uncharacterized protein n=1 Tax=Trichostrongylus colubriformis TaxID=6319 RepID=A0AAN8IV94_TRICO
MSSFRNEKVTRFTFLFLTVLQLLWVVWISQFMTNVFNVAEVSYHIIGLLVIATALTCGCCVAKIIALQSGFIHLERIVELVLVSQLALYIHFQRSSELTETDAKKK